MVRILVVDDSRTIRKMIIASLKPLNAAFTEVGSGIEAVDELMVHKYDAVTLDLNMPDMHGIELLKFLKNHQAFMDIPVLVITTHSDNVSPQVLQAGANGFMVKPFTPGELLQTMQKLLDSSDTDNSLKRQ
jgi:two-component system, chemotaxis family, chemotaxis protein CheY